MKESEVLDIIIIGGGPIGLACGIYAQKAGLHYVILEKGVLVNSLFHYPVNMTFFSTSEKLEIGDVPFVSNNKRPTRNEALEYYRRIVTSFRLNIHLFEKVEHLSKTENQFEVKTSSSVYSGKNLIIATGFYDTPYLLDVKGEDLPKVKHYYDDPHFYAFQDVLVIGASNSAVDAALETWRKGAHVTMAIREDKIGERVKYWVRPDVINRIKEGSIKAYFNTTVAEILPKEVKLKTPEGIITLPNDWVLAMTGYQPDILFLKSLGIHLSTDGVFKPEYNEKTHETNIRGVYLAGVICGGLNTHRLFIENSREHAKKIIRNIHKTIKNKKRILI